MAYTKRMRTLYFICFAALLFICARTSALAQEPADSKADVGVGLLRASDFGMAKIVAYTIFGAIGFVAFMYGKKNAFWKPMIIGFALMAYPYFLSGTVAIYLVGIALTAALYFLRE